jgi:two-component system cell cycle response regulator
MSEEEKTLVHSISDLLSRTRQQSAYLIVLQSKVAATVGRMYKLDRPEVILGRSTEAALQVEDDGISRKHAKVCLGPDHAYQLMDLGSTNGTYLNGDRVNVARLSDGDKIQIGSNTVLKFSLQDQLEEQYQRNIYESATRDGLTRIYNKKYFLDSVRKEFAYCLRHRMPLSVVMIDVDHFKRVNDTFGHQAGDYVLARVALRVGETIRGEDLFARYGGEEFALMLRESSELQALQCAERCRRAVDGTEFAFGGAPIKVSVSLGVATLSDNDFVQPEDLIAEADKYLYLAKQHGRNRVEGRSGAVPQTAG